MQHTLDDSISGWDRTFLDLSSKMTEPFCSVWNLLCFRLVAPLDPQKFENCSTKTREVATRTLIGLGAVLGAYLSYLNPLAVLSGVIGLGVASKVARAIGFAFQKEGYTHIRGVSSEKTLDSKNPEAKLMTWNVCGIGGGLSLDHGGVIHWRSRLDGIVAKIKSEDPDVLVLQEIYDAALAEALIDKLKNDYAHFYIHMGPTLMGNVGGCMVLSKCAVHHFSHTSFENNDWTLNRGFANVEIKASPKDTRPCLSFIGTHLIHGSSPESNERRFAQVRQIVNSVKRRTFAIPTLLAGDLNLERDKPEGKILSDHLTHAYLGNESTCTNGLSNQWSKKTSGVDDEIIDYISLFKRTLPDGSTLPVIDTNIELANCHQVRAYDSTYNTKTALSDHNGISLTVKGLYPR